MNILLYYTVSFVLSRTGLLIGIKSMDEIIDLSIMPSYSLLFAYLYKNKKINYVQ